ncbi:MAG TPA: RNA methyltransferase [Halanaerobiales bacterium]|nr:RNA methyltransferase [Halanaerobiales bacterium]
MNKNVFIALLHHPVYNKDGEVITTTVTNYDLHDISRAARTYGINKYYVVNQLKSQQSLVKRMRDYWTSGFGADYNGTRHEAFKVMEIADTLADTIEDIKNHTGEKPTLITTSAQKSKETISFTDLKEKMHSTDQPYLIIFGTGWGLTKEIIEKSDYLLEPVTGNTDYNHLSVRSAASIIMDRLLS